MPTDRRDAGPNSLGRLMAGGTVAGLTDVELLGRYLRSSGLESEVAFEALVSLHGPMVLRVCLSILDDHHDAQDAFQATFLILARRAGSIRKARSLAPWLHGVALRVSRTARVGAARRLAHERRAALSSARQFVQVDREAIALVHEELGLLPDRYRAPLLLCDLEGLTHDRAADQLGWPVGTVKSRLARGRQRLRVGLARRGLDPEAGCLAMVVAAGNRAGMAESLITASRIVLVLSKGCPSSASPSIQVAFLTRKVLLAMTLPKIRVLAGLALASGLVGVGAFRAASSWADARLPDAPPSRPTSLVADSPTPRGGPEGSLPLALTRPRPWETAAKVEVLLEGIQQSSPRLGSGVIVRSDDDEALIVTAAHIFRADDRPAEVRPERFLSKVRVRLFEGEFVGQGQPGLKPANSYRGKLVEIDHGADVALVQIRPGRRLPASPVAEAEPPVKAGQPVVSVGCSDGEDATAWSTEVTKVRVPLLVGGKTFEVIECRHAPRQGRSGGGLFNLDGEVVGVTCYANPA